MSMTTVANPSPPDRPASRTPSTTHPHQTMAIYPYPLTPAPPYGRQGSGPPGRRADDRVRGHALVRRWRLRTIPAFALALVPSATPKRRSDHLQDARVLRTTGRAPALPSCPSWREGTYPIAYRPRHVARWAGAVCSSRRMGTCSTLWNSGRVRSHSDPSAGSRRRNRAVRQFHGLRSKLALMRVLDDEAFMLACRKSGSPRVGADAAWSPVVDCFGDARDWELGARFHRDHEPGRSCAVTSAAL